MYSCHGWSTLSSERSSRCGRKPSTTCNLDTHKAEKTNDRALKTNASSYPNDATALPPKKDPIVTAVHCVNWVREFAVCSSVLLAMAGSIDARPLVKNGEANI